MVDTCFLTSCHWFDCFELKCTLFDMHIYGR